MKPKPIATGRAALWAAPFAGAALALAFAPFDWWWLAIVCPAFLFLVWREAAPKRAAQLGFLFTAGVYLAGTYWLYYSIHGIGQAPLWLTFIVMLGLVAIMSAYTAFVGYALARWVVLGAGRSDAAMALRYLLVLPAAWVFLEWFRGWFLSGFPWLALGYTQIDTPLSGWAPVGGVYTVSLAVAMSAGATALMVIGSSRQRLAAAAVFVAVWGGGWALTQPAWTQPVGAPMTVAIVQGAVPQDLKWSPEHRDSTVRLYAELTAPHLGKDVIVWPEAALPILAHDALGRIEPLLRATRSGRSTLITGLVRYDFDRDEYYNGLVVLDDTPQWYYKRRLVPFGEFFPVPQFIREWLRLMNLPYSDLTPGGRDQAALAVADQGIGVTICYEDAYAAEQLDVLRDATLLVNVTNDAWFGDSTAAHQHLQISRMRALEAGRPLLRAANDGISAVLDASGAVQDTLPRFQPGVLTGVVQPHAGLTPYALVGNVPVVIACVLALLAGCWPTAMALRRRVATRAAAGSR